MGITASRIKHDDEEILEVYHVSETFSHHKEWQRIIKEYDHESNTDLISEVTITHRGSQPPFTIYAIQGNNNKQSIQQVCHDQPQLSACHTIFVFCAHTSFILSSESLVDTQRSLRQRINDYWNPYHVDKIEWAKRQAYYAVGFAIQSCEKEHIACYAVEGFSIPSLCHLLHIPKDRIPVSMLTIGSPD
jgi:nitroreductase